MGISPSPVHPIPLPHSLSAGTSADGNTHRKSLLHNGNLSADTIYVNLDYTALGAGKDVTTVEKLTPELLEKIMEESTTLQGMYLRASSFQEVSYKTQKQSANLVGVTSGYAGVALSFPAIALMSFTEIPLYPSWDGKVVACIFAVATSTLFGFYPAYKASLLMPIQALAEE